MDSDERIYLDGIFGRIVIRCIPRMRTVNIEDYIRKLPENISLESVLKANDCDSEGYTKVQFIASKNITLTEDEQNVSSNIEPNLEPAYSAMGDTALEALQALYKLLAEYEALKEFNRLTK